jgi:hypothetical protein
MEVKRNHVGYLCVVLKPDQFSFIFVLAPDLMIKVFENCRVYMILVIDGVYG